MQPTETVKLVSLVAALCPGQQLADMTADAWSIVLDDVDYAEAVAAVRTIYRDRGKPDELGYRRVEADAILREVRRVRSERLANFDPEQLVPPAGLSVQEELEWCREARRVVARGGEVPVGNRGELRARPMRELLTGKARTP